MINSGNWALRRWDNNNPSLTSPISSSLKSLLSWTISRYGYELRVNGDVVATNVSGNWRPEALFDRITGDTEWMAGEILLYPRVLELAEKQKIEGYLAKNWKMQADLPEDHPYKFTFPKGAPGFVLNGTPERAGIYEVSVTAQNQWGSVTDTFNLEVQAKPPKSQTADATQVGSSSARLQANVFDLGGMDSNLSFFWGTDPGLSGAAETSVSSVSQTGKSSILLTNLGSSITYYYRAKLVNAGGLSNGDSLSAVPAHFWDLNDSGLTALDQVGIINGVINGASTTLDASKGNVLSFDGDNDYVNLGDVEEMDQADRFTISLWFKRSADSSTEATANGIDNVLIAQASDSSNDNLEIGTQGSEIEIYVDSGTASTDQTVRVEAGITNDVWYHLALVYGSEMSVYLDGIKVSTWTQYNGRLESSGSSPLSIGCARPDRGNPWGDFSGEMHRRGIILRGLEFG
jgi:hypothetical protein